MSPQLATVAHNDGQIQEVNAGEHLTQPTFRN